MQLFDPDDDGQAQADHPWTAHEAARKVKAGSQRDRVLRALYAAGQEDGALDHELAAATGLERTHAATRRHELEELGLAHRNGDHRPAPRTGNAALITRITDAGIAFIEAAATEL